jgi:RNA polymerase sigma-70 factor (ECF subfamily)
LRKSPDEALIKRAKALEPGALAEIYERHIDPIYRYIYMRVRNQADAEDLTGQVFLKMIDALPGYRLQGVPFSTWLYRIAHNLVIDRYRRSSRVPLELSEQLPDSGPFALPEARLQTSEDRRRLVAALGRLTDDQRQVILLRFIENVEVEQIARIMHRSRGAIHAMQHRALASLNRVLAEAVPVEARRA